MSSAAPGASRRSVALALLAVLALRLLDPDAGLGLRAGTDVLGALLITSALMLAVFMFSLAGIPPTVGFFAKMAVLQALVAAAWRRFSSRWPRATR